MLTKNIYFNNFKLGNKFNKKKNILYLKKSTGL